METKHSLIRVLMAKTGIDGHWVGPMLVSMAMRDAGMEVIHARQMMPGEIAQTAIQEDVDVIGLNVCGRYETIKRVMEALHDQKADDNRLIIVGGVIPQEEIPRLKALGVHECFPPGSSLEDIVQYIKNNVGKFTKVVANTPDA